jgi:nucleotide-binding universal stress UspA family protein
MFGRIMVYIDGSEESITAAQYAVCLSSYTGGELTALYVVNTRALDDLVKSRIFIKTEEEEYRRDLESDAQRYLNHVRELAHRKGVAIETVHETGAVHTEIKKKVEELEIDLLVIGELARIRSRRDEFYNEADRAMRSVACPVLIVKNLEEVWDMYEAL